MNSAAICRGIWLFSTSKYFSCITLRLFFNPCMKNNPPGFQWQSHPSAVEPWWYNHGLYKPEGDTYLSLPIGQQCNTIRLLQTDFHLLTFDMNRCYRKGTNRRCLCMRTQAWACEPCCQLIRIKHDVISLHLGVVASQIVCANLTGPYATSWSFAFRFHVTLMSCIFFFQHVDMWCCHYTCLPWWCKPCFGHQRSYESITRTDRGSRQSWWRIS